MKQIKMRNQKVEFMVPNKIKLIKSMSKLKN